MLEKSFKHWIKLEFEFNENEWPFAFWRSIIWSIGRCWVLVDFGLVVEPKEKVLVTFNWRGWLSARSEVGGDDDPGGETLIPDENVSWAELGADSREESGVGDRGIALWSGLSWYGNCCGWDDTKSGFGCCIDETFSVAFVFDSADKTNNYSCQRTQTSQILYHTGHTIEWSSLVTESTKKKVQI